MVHRYICQILPQGVWTIVRTFIFRLECSPIFCYSPFGLRKLKRYIDDLLMIDRVNTSFILLSARLLNAASHANEWLLLDVPLVTT